MSFMLLCCMKYEEPGSAKHDAQRALREANKANMEEDIGLLSLMVLQHKY